MQLAAACRRLVDAQLGRRGVAPSTARARRCAEPVTGSSSMPTRGREARGDTMSKRGVVAGRGHVDAASRRRARASAAKSGASVAHGRGVGELDEHEERPCVRRRAPVRCRARRADRRAPSTVAGGAAGKSSAIAPSACRVGAELAAAGVEHRVGVRRRAGRSPRARARSRASRARTGRPRPRA